MARIDVPVKVRERKKVQYEHTDECGAKGQKTGKADIHAEEFENRQPKADVPEFNPEHQRAKTLEKKRAARRWPAAG